MRAGWETRRRRRCSRSPPECTSPHGPGPCSRALAEAGHDKARADELAALVEALYVDQKALDAAAGLELLGRLDDVRAPTREKPRHVNSRGFDALVYSDVLVRRRVGALRGYQLVDDVALHEPDFEELLHRAVDRHLLVHLSADLEQRVSDDERAMARARLLRRLDLTEDDLPAWLVNNDLDEQRLDQLAQHQARIFRLRRWMLDGMSLERNRRMVTEQLQLEGRYDAAADAAARRRRWADDRPEPPQPTSVPEVAELVAHQKVLAGWAPDRPLAELADEQGFDSLGGLYVALADSRAAGEVRQERLRKLNRVLGRSADLPTPGPGARMLAMLESFQDTYVLRATIDLGVPAALAGGGRAARDVARELGLDPERLVRLLGTLAVLGVVRRDGDLWYLTDEGHFLTPPDVDGQPSLLAGAAHVDELMDTWAQLSAAIRGDDPPGCPDSAAADEHGAAASDVLGLTEAVLAAVDPPPFGRVVDLGGGLGHLAQALAQRHPGVDLVVAELPGPARRARERLARIGLAERVEVLGLDGRTDLGEAVDLCIILGVLVTLDDEQAVRLLELARRSLAPGGRIEVFEPELDGSPAANLSDLLNLVRSGGAVRSPDNWRGLAARAGLRTLGREPIVSSFAHFTFEPEATS